jgi:hypothetical protein
MKKNGFVNKQCNDLKIKCKMKINLIQKINFWKCCNLIFIFDTLITYRNYINYFTLLLY